MALPTPHRTKASSVATAGQPRLTYLRFLGHSLWLATEGSLAFYAWMTVLTAVFLVGANAWAHQVVEGMILTNMTDHVSWGLYIANFTFIVGLAAGGVMMVIPAYVYRQRKMHDVVIIGEMLAIASIVMCLMFVMADLGRPERAWHLIPGIGKFNFPISMLTWDVIVLNGYLLLNLHIVGYLLYMRYLGRRPNPVWYVPFVMVSIIWAISIHTVTAFLYCGLGGRPFWNSALLAPRFLASAFVSGPAMLIVTLLLLRRVTPLKDVQGPVKTLTAIVRVTILVNLLMLVSELFTLFYTGGTHASSGWYLFFGIDGHRALVPWIWTSVAMNVLAAILFLRPQVAGGQHNVTLVLACVLAFVGIWIEKGMGLIIPGFIPGPLHQIVEYTPSLTEWRITAGIWAAGLMLFTVGIKTALPTLIHIPESEQRP